MVTFITSNQSKADYLAKYLGVELRHQKVDLAEIQSLNLQEIVKHKLRQAYEVVQAPVLVEDVSLEFTALHGLPGPFIKWFVDNVPFEKICRMVDGMDRTATAACVFGYFDGQTEKYFTSSLGGKVAENPKGTDGFGWDAIFVPDGCGGRTRAELTEAENEATYRAIKPLDQLKDFLGSSQP